MESRSPVLRTPRLALFVPTDADRADVARLCADPQVMACFPRPLTSDEADAWFERIRAAHARDGFGVWTVKVLSAEGETFAGVVGLARPAFAPSASRSSGASSPTSGDGATRRKPPVLSSPPHFFPIGKC